MDIPITQSKEWQHLQDDLGETSFFEKTADYQFLAILKKTPVGNYLYLPYGPIFKDQKSFKAAFSAVSKLANKHQAIFIRIEPRDPNFSSYKPKNTKKVKDLNPKDTWVLDLSADKDTLISNFSQGTRTRYNTYAKKGLIVESTQDLDQIKELITLQNKLYRTKKLHTFSEKYLKTELKQPFATLYLVKYHQSTDLSRQNLSQNLPQNAPQPGNYPSDGQVIAASLFFDYKDTRYYMQSASDTEFKKLPATVALLTKALFDAKEQGIKNFDFWGIAPDGAPSNHPWAGFTEFKKSFGGSAIHYAGTYDVIINPVKYKLYQIFRKIYYSHTLSRLKSKLKH